MDNKEFEEVTGISSLLPGSIAAFELFTSYCEAGFTENQAIKLIAAAFMVGQQKDG